MLRWSCAGHWCPQQTLLRPEGAIVVARPASWRLSREVDSEKFVVCKFCCCDCCCACMSVLDRDL